MVSDFRRHGIKISCYPVLESVLKCWQKLNASPEWLEAGDAPWWYNERASLSFFAGAVWLNRGWAFEEFSTSREVMSRGRINSTHGRSDIAFKVKDTFFLAEAKQCWPRLTTGNIEVALNHVVQSLDKACKEVPRASGQGYKRIGMVFVAPSIHKSKEANLEKRRAELIGRLQALRGYTVAWTFPKAAQALKPDNRYHSYIYPGTILVVKKAG